MAALKRLKEAATLLSSDQSRAALLRLPLLETSVSLLSKPCIPPALGPRPTEVPCSPPSPFPFDCHQSRSSRNVHRDVHKIDAKSQTRHDERFSNLQSARAVSVYQWASGISALTRDLPWFGSSSASHKTDHKNTTPPNTFDQSNVQSHRALFSHFLQDTRHTEHHGQLQVPSPSIDLIKCLCSLDESQLQLPFDAVILQQADRLERTQEPPTSPAAAQGQQEQTPHSQKQLERRGEQPEGRRVPSDKATPAQMSFILLKLREELPAFFDGHHSYDIYDANMMFENNLPPQGWSTDTRRSYRLFMESSRLALKVYFAQTSLDLIKITKDVDHGKIEARWRVRGRQRFLFSLKETVLIEGFSTFLVNSSGLISLHRMDRVMPAPTKEKLRNSWRVWLGKLVGVASPKSPLPQPDLLNSVSSKYG